MMQRHRVPIVFSALVLSSLLWSTGCGSDSTSTSPTTPTVTDDSPPLVPTGLHVTKSDGNGCALSWKDSSEADLAGYYVYVLDPEASGNAGYVPLQPTPLPRSGYVFAPSQSHTPQASYFLRVSAVDFAGNESALSQSIEVCIGSAPPEGELEQDPGVNGDQFTDFGSGPDEGRDAPGVPGRNPSIEQPERR